MTDHEIVRGIDLRIGDVVRTDGWRHRVVDRTTTPTGGVIVTYDDGTTRGHNATSTETITKRESTLL